MARHVLIEYTRLKTDCRQEEEAKCRQRCYEAQQRSWQPGACSRHMRIQTQDCSYAMGYTCYLHRQEMDEDTVLFTWVIFTHSSHLRRARFDSPPTHYPPLLSLAKLGIAASFIFIPYEFIIIPEYFREPGWLSRYSDWLQVGRSGFDSRQGLRIFLFDTATRPALGPTQPPVEWVPGSLSLGVKRPGCEADHSTPSIAEVKGCVELYHHYPNVLMVWCWITFTYYSTVCKL
jgi:hypothetical protein